MRRVSLFAATAVCAFPCFASAAFTSTYDFSGLSAGTIPSVPTTSGDAPPAGVSFQGVYTNPPIGGVGQIGPDNWVWTSSTPNFYSSYVRNDASNGMSGNYVASYPTPANSATGSAPLSYDTINSRKNDANFGYSVANGAIFRAGFTAAIQGINYTNATGAATSTTSRAELGLGFDQNGDGDIRGDAANAENAEWGPIFGFEPASGAGTAGLTGKFYLRPAGLGTAVTVNASGPGVYRFELEINPNTNPVAATANNYAGNDGSGTLYVQQLFDADGNAVSDSLHAIAGLTDINLGLTRMNAHNSTNVGTVNGWNPAYWNGFFTRLSNNGTMDTVQFTPEPASLGSLAIAGAALIRRRKAR